MVEGEADGMKNFKELQQDISKQFRERMYIRPPCEDCKYFWPTYEGEGVPFTLCQSKEMKCDFSCFELYVEEVLYE